MTLEELNLNRFLGVQNPNSIVGLTSPFQGIQSGLNIGTSLQQNYFNSQFTNLPNGITPGSIISNVTIRTSSGGQVIPSLGVKNGRVELNQGFTTPNGAQFPFDSLTAFDEFGNSAVTLFNGGILFAPKTPGGTDVAEISYIYGPNTYYIQPISLGTGTVDSTGTPTSNFPSTWSVTHLGTGTYEIVPTNPFPNTNYQVIVTAQGFAPYFANVSTTALDHFEVLIYDQTGTLIDAGFSFAVFTNLA